MDLITNTGFRHIFERILRCLTTKDLLSIRNLNTSFRCVLNDPNFWINQLQVVGRKKLKIKWVEVMEYLKESNHHLIKQKSILLDCITNCLIKLHKEMSILKDADRYFENVTLVHIVARYDNVELLKLFRKFYSDEEFYSYDDLGNQPFHEAAQRGNCRSLKYLTEIQENVIVWDRVVLIAAAKGHINVLKFVTEFLRDLRDFDINSITTSDGKQRTPICLAAENNRLRALKYLVPLSKQPFKSDSFGNTPLHFAAKNGNTKIVKYLLASNHEPNPRSSNGTTPIHAAAHFNRLNILKILIPISNNFLEDFNARGWNALHIAALEGNLDIIKYMFKKCKKLDTPNPITGANAIHYAAENGHIEVLKYLVKRIPKPIIIPSFNGSNAIHLASSNGHLNVVEFLFKLTPTPNDPVIHQPNATPLNIAKGHNRLDVVDVIETLNRTSKFSRKRKRSLTKSQ